MKKVILPLVTAIMMSTTGVIYAADQPGTAATGTKTTTATSETSSNATTNATIKLYAEPNAASNVVATVDVSQQLVPIFQKDGWIKVGNPSDGTVGWINKDQYHQAVDTAFKQSFQTVYIQQIQEKGKEPQIVVYQNGQKLTGDQAKAVVANMQKQQMQMQKNMQMMQQHIDAWMNQPLLAFPMMAMPQPVIIIQNTGAKNTTTDKTSQTKPKIAN